MEGAQNEKTDRDKTIPLRDLMGAGIRSGRLILGL
jgi:hypothetical protein